MRKTATALTVVPPAEYFSFRAQCKHGSAVAVWTAQIQQRMKGDALTRTLAGIQNHPGIRKMQELGEAKPKKLDLHQPLE